MLHIIMGAMNLDRLPNDWPKPIAVARLLLSPKKYHKNNIFLRCLQDNIIPALLIITEIAVNDITLKMSKDDMKNVIIAIKYILLILLK